MDIHCIEIYCDDRDFDLKPWQQNGGIVYEEDKIILREMWKLHREAEGIRNPSKDKAAIQGKAKNRDSEIKSKLTSLGFGIPKSTRHKKK